MNKRIMAAVLAIVMTVCVFAPAALAASSVEVGSSGAGQATMVLLGGESGSISGKVAASQNGNDYTFSIHTALSDADWQEQNGEKYLRIETHYTIPEAVATDTSITKYYVQFSDDGVNWLNPGRASEPDIQSLGNKNSPLNGGTRYDKSQYDNGNGFVQYSKYVWLDEAGVQVGEPAVLSVSLELAYLPTAIPTSRIAADGTDGLSPAISGGLVTYSPAQTFAGSSAVTNITPPSGAYASDCAVYADPAYTSTAANVAASGTELTVTTAIDITATAVSEQTYYVRWNMTGGAIKTEKLKIAVVPPAYANTGVENMGGVTVVGMGSYAGCMALSTSTNVDISDSANANDPAESRTSAPLVNNLIYTITDAADWYALYLNSPSSQEVLIGLRMALPSGTQTYVLLGTNINAPDEYVVSALDSYTNDDNKREPVSANGAKYAEMLETIAMAGVDGSSMLFTPCELEGTICLKWWDEYDIAHYGRVDIHMRPADEGETEKTYKYSDCIPDAVRVTAYSSPASTASYSDGTIVYALDGEDYSSGVELYAEILRPNASATSLRCNGDDVRLDSDGRATLGVGLDSCNRVNVGSWRLEWLYENGDLLDTEMLFWQTDPVTEDYWMLEAFSPAPLSRTRLIGVDACNSDLFRYDTETGAWCFEIPNSIDLATLDLDALCDYGLDYPSILPPSGAVSCRVDYWFIGLYDNNPDIVVNSMATQQLENVSGLDGGAARLHSGKYCVSSTLDGMNMQVYSVRDTIVCNADMMFVQWYDANGDAIVLDGSGTTIEYIMLILKPYQAVTDIAALEPGASDADMSAAAALGRPFAVVDGLEGVYYLRSEELIVTEVNAGANGRYQLLDLHLVDAYGNDVSIPAGSTVSVYWPYPAGVTYVADEAVMRQRYNVTVDHYTGSGELLTADPMELTYTPYGVCYQTTSFSPFLMKYTKNAGNTRPWSPSVTYSPEVPATGSPAIGGVLLFAAGALLAGMVVLHRRRSAM